MQLQVLEALEKVLAMCLSGTNKVLKGNEDVELDRLLVRTTSQALLCLPSLPLKTYDSTHHTQYLHSSSRLRSASFASAFCLPSMVEPGVVIVGIMGGHRSSQLASTKPACKGTKIWARPQVLEGVVLAILPDLWRVRPQVRHKYRSHPRRPPSRRRYLGP